MDGMINWDKVYAAYDRAWSDICAGCDGAPRFELPEAALARIAAPADTDLQWLAAALRADGEYPRARRWFVAWLFPPNTRLPESLFAPMLDAAITEVDPSMNRRFVEPCLATFGARRVSEYLLAIVESGQSAGAINALYWAEVELTFSGNLPSIEERYATAESREASHAKQAVRRTA